MNSTLQDFADSAIKYAETKGVRYCDVRAEEYEKKSALLEDSQIEHIRTEKDRGIGIRVIKEDVWNFCSITNPQSFEQIKEEIDKLVKNATYNSKNEKTG